MEVQTTVGLVNVTMTDWTIGGGNLTFRTAVASNMTAICGPNADEKCTAEDVLIFNTTYMVAGTRRVQHDQLIVGYKINVMSNVAEEAVIIIDSMAYSEDFLIQLQKSGLRVVSINIIHKATATVKTLSDKRVVTESDVDETQLDVIFVITIALPLTVFICCMLWFLCRRSKRSETSNLQYSSSLKKEFVLADTLSEKIPSDLSSVRLLFGSMRLILNMNVTFFVFPLGDFAFLCRFPAPQQAKQLEIELKKLGIRLKIVDINAGGDIDHEAST